ncbi:MAG: DUF952 domain-containing protein [Chloroflexi bacterium]|nr:DUF952 domain-containing protein [Chloroflexota bacterium]
MATIFHITTRELWRRSIPRGQYTHESLRAEGFIHCSIKEQVLGVANTRFTGQDDLVLLSIDTSDVMSVIQYDKAPGSDETFPHIYGPLNHDAVKAVIDFPPSDGGSFALPPDLQE